MSLFNLFGRTKPTISIDAALISSERFTGAFQVAFNVEDAKITLKNKDGRVLWENTFWPCDFRHTLAISDTPFLQSSQGTDDIGPGEGGAFEIHERDVHTTGHQTIVAIKHAGGDTVRVEGTLAERAGTAPSLSYSFEFGEPVIVYASRKEEQFYGFGEQFSFCGAKGEKVPILVRYVGCFSSLLMVVIDMDVEGVVVRIGMIMELVEFIEFIIYPIHLESKGIGRGTQPHLRPFHRCDRYTTYAPIPHYITTDNRSVFLENTEYSSFDLRKDDRVVIRVTAKIVTGRILNAPTVVTFITEYTSHVGRMRPLPPWTGLGAIAGMRGGSRKDWCGERVQKVCGKELKRLWRNWENDEELYPDWDELVRELRAGDVRVLSYVNTVLADVRSKANGLRKKLFVEAAGRGLLVMYPTRDDGRSGMLVISSGLDFEARLLDLTNAETWWWLKDVLKECVFKYNVASKLHGRFWRVHALLLVALALQLGRPYHNAYPHEWARMHDEVVRELGVEREVVLFHRSAFTLSPGRMNLMWTGDQNAAWDEHDGIKSSVGVVDLCMGSHRYALWWLLGPGHHAFGYTTFAANNPGFNMVHSRELLFRWMDHGVL
ncbi:hypothetical protein BC936DRAFT_138186 [Jimgerdemannia flammicorona]|uniref:Glycoside hydrolase family 31 TIM barrel domain-containing protein n=1 Tax=Jimgerdemannia flammicorona TaxID=994334 RepID=A0A433DIP9_9FUNG|nr:hypothetical protein BC936DRAFT_138186 [Jimgerdemannia flammicorona]